MLDPAKVREWNHLEIQAAGGIWKYDPVNRIITWAYDEQDDPELVCDCISEDEALFFIAAREAVPTLIEALVDEKTARHELEISLIRAKLAIRLPDGSLVLNLPGTAMREGGAIMRTVSSEAREKALAELGLE